MDPHIEEIKKNYPDVQIEICDSEFKIQFLKGFIKIPYESDLQRFKKQLKKMVKSFQNTECNVCFEDYKNSVYCNKCCNNVCLACYNKIRIKGKGVFTCPYCRHKEGKTFQTDMDMLINLCKRNTSGFAEECIPSNIIPAIGIYIKYLKHEKKYIFESGGIFKEFDGRCSDECKEFSAASAIKFHDELIPFFKGNPVFEKVTENNN